MLNQSAPDGSASRSPPGWRVRGWEIGRVDDFHGNVSTTTVYWLHPEPASGRPGRSRGYLSGAPRVQEGFNTLVDDRVSVILVD